MARTAGLALVNAETVKVWRIDGADLLLSVRLTPGAAKDDVGGLFSDARGDAWLSARVRAVPEKGRANAALIEVMAKRLGVAKGAISLESGDTNRLKRLRIADGGREPLHGAIMARINEWTHLA